MKASSSDAWLDDCFAGFLAYYLTSLPVLLGLLYGIDFLHAPDGRSMPLNTDLISACYHFDALHYLEIIRAGYSYDPDQRSTPISAERKS